MRKFFGILFLLIGLAGLGFGAYYTANIYMDANSITEYNNKPTENKVIIKGNLKTVANIVDNELNVEATSAILIREVEMVQWYQDEDGIRLVLANYPIPSFSDNGVDYKNPDFYNIFASKDYLGTATINGLRVDGSVLQEIAKQVKLGSINKKSLEELPNNANKRYDLVVRNGEYVSAGDQWELGDVKISYYTIDQDNTSFTIVGDISNNTISIKDGGLVYDGNIDKVTAISDLFKTSYAYIAIGSAGLLFTIIGLIILRKGKKNKKEKKMAQ